MLVSPITSSQLKTENKKEVEYQDAINFDDIFSGKNLIGHSNEFINEVEKIDKPHKEKNFR